MDLEEIFLYFMRKILRISWSQLGTRNINIYQKFLLKIGRLFDEIVFYFNWEVVKEIWNNCCYYGEAKIIKMIFSTIKLFKRALVFLVSWLQDYTLKYRYPSLKPAFEIESHMTLSGELNYINCL